MTTSAHLVAFVLWFLDEDFERNEIVKPRAVAQPRASLAMTLRAADTLARDEEMLSRTLSGGDHFVRTAISIAPRFAS